MNKEKKSKMAFGKRFVLHANAKSNYGISYLVFQKHYLLSIFAIQKLTLLFKSDIARQ